LSKSSGSEQRINELFLFIKSRRAWNTRFQLAEYRRCLSACDSAHQRIVALMHMVVHTQSKPKLSALATFWQWMNSAPWGNRAPTLVELIDFIERTEAHSHVAVGPWDRLFRALEAIDGWGPKTAALFVKCVINLHRSNLNELHFISDVEAARGIDSDRVYLPVDAVIRAIFSAVAEVSATVSVHALNTFLRDLGYGPEDILLWDDLWYWGFFTQNSSSKKRVFGWNPARFWGELSAPKADIHILEEECTAFSELMHS